MPVTSINHQSYTDDELQEADRRNRAAAQTQPRRRRFVGWGVTLVVFVVLGLWVAGLLGAEPPKLETRSDRSVTGPQCPGSGEEMTPLRDPGPYIIASVCEYNNVIVAGERRHRMAVVTCCDGPQFRVLDASIPEQAVEMAYWREKLRRQLVTH